jgi:Kef-type K+ transport system membrane component KefB
MSLFIKTCYLIVKEHFVEQLRHSLEVDTPQGRTALGILIFQDLLAIPMMLSVALPDGDERFQEDDVVVLLGLPELLPFADNIFNPH